MTLQTQSVAADRIRRSLPLRALLATGAMLWVLQGMPPALAAADPPAEQIALKASEVDKVQNWSGKSTVQNVSKDGGTRQRQAEVANMLRDGSSNDAMRLYKFEAPADISGTALLIHENSKGDDDLWLYLPAAGKSRRIVASNKKNSFVGTQFAFVDLMTQSVQEYKHTLAGHEMVDGVDCYIVDSEPKTESFAGDIGYSKERAWIRSDILAAVRVDYYDLQGKLLKTQRLTDYVAADKAHGKWIAGKRQMVNHQSGEQTVIAFADIAVNSGSIDEGTFSPSRLGRR
jgi:hypothetical protein